MWLYWGINLNHIYMKYNYIWFGWERVVNIGTREPSPAHATRTQHSQLHCLWTIQGIASPDFLGGKMVKNLPANAANSRDMGSIPGWGISSEIGNVNLFQYSCLKSPKDRGAWWATVLGVTKSWTWLSDWAHTDSFPSRRTDHIPSAVLRGF